LTSSLASEGRRLTQRPVEFSGNRQSWQRSNTTGRDYPYWVFRFLWINRVSLDRKHWYGSLTEALEQQPEADRPAADEESD
jgi:hypothetical protein